MNNSINKVTKEMNFYNGNDPRELAEKFGTPLYVYNESILRTRCREIKNMCKFKNFRVNYSAKANSNLAILQVVRSEGLDVDAMSPGEIMAELAAGFAPQQILYISNNVSEDEMRFAIDKCVNISVDSLSQLEMYGRINSGGRIIVRINPGHGAGHHASVVTAGKNTKFAVNLEYLEEMRGIIKKYNLKLIGLNHHIGSLFMEGEPYMKAMDAALSVAMGFDCLEFIDIGGGFGVPYHKQQDQERLNTTLLGQLVDSRMNAFAEEYEKRHGKEITLKIEPGRYIAAECGVLLGTVHAVKYNDETRYAGTDLGFNTLIRPAMYGSHHDIEVYPLTQPYNNTAKDTVTEETVTVVGNICETGDILAKDRVLPKLTEGDVIGVLDAGAYGFVMSSNYNNRLRPAEVLIREDGETVLIRRRDTFDDLMKAYVLL